MKCVIAVVRAGTVRSALYEAGRCRSAGRHRAERLYEVRHCRSAGRHRGGAHCTKRDLWR